MYNFFSFYTLIHPFQKHIIFREQEACYRPVTDRIKLRTYLLT